MSPLEVTEETARLASELTSGITNALLKLTLLFGLVSEEHLQATAAGEQQGSDQGELDDVLPFIVSKYGFHLVFTISTGTWRASPDPLPASHDPGRSCQEDLIDAGDEGFHRHARGHSDAMEVYRPTNVVPNAPRAVTMAKATRKRIMAYSTRDCPSRARTIHRDACSMIPPRLALLSPITAVTTQSPTSQRSH